MILDEWLNMGVVTLHEDMVKLNANAFIPSKGIEEKAFFLGHNISDHLAAATHNIQGLDPAFFDRCVYYDGLSEASIEQLRELAAERGMQTLVEINELAIKLKAQDAAQSDSGAHEKHRLNIGLYVYHEAEGSGHE